MSDAVWTTVHHERAALAGDLETLRPEQWTAPTACPGWDVHDVVAHLVDGAKTTRFGFVRDMVAARFDFDRQNELGIARERRADPAETLAELRAVTGLTRTPPAPLATRLVEVFVHGADIRRAVGLTGDYPPEQVAVALEFQVRTSVKMGGGRERAAGVRLVAEDTAVRIGTGPEVRGTALALLLAVSGRPVDPDELTAPQGWASIRPR
ncbi:maleylpyruvate isomerase family mycothiol-dependent enzyme [Actinoplanes sichuanensis]|uniref:Maleylpyruvate isomerase family mycothiol-dependent enzyme n=1 Tax=Actinoplanes sichuanensis TaxID=512349 RepID=A0ABW4AK05_9ACTN|nr:maleylpyruvate isomerase family mycothiol-dependent enzyme [Actinoplanes sichuanensis]BEL03717.1 maleylpyruvate isomerase family mycothiol-dependent enzyme [Actinoplanes sichuanensis]